MSIQERESIYKSIFSIDCRLFVVLNTYIYLYIFLSHLKLVGLKLNFLLEVFDMKTQLPKVFTRLNGRLVGGVPVVFGV